MTLGEKLRQARQQCGLSQLQVAGSFMTRNMLSQLENDLASPSVKTLCYLADTLGVSVGWLLDENTAAEFASEKERFRTLYRHGEYFTCMRCLAAADLELDEEMRFLLFRSALACAAQSLSERKLADAERFLAVAGDCQSIYIGKQDTLEFNLLRMQAALEKGTPDQALLQQIVECAPLASVNMLSARHDLLQGRLLTEKKAYADALVYLHRAETAGVLPHGEKQKLYRLLECCYKELEDYKQAYYYATLRMN